MVFENSDCKKNNTCDLKWFSLLREDFAIVRNSLLHYATRSFLEYETASVESLTNYGVVKFIRGCIFDSYVENGQTLKVRRTGKVQFGSGFRFFHFPNWVIDSYDKDPMYPSFTAEEEEDVKKNRHYFYRWNPRGLHDSKYQKFFGEERPPWPRLYVADISAPAFLWDDTFKEAQNVSLEFRACIYKIGDIPLRTTQENIDFAKPIHCFQWNSSFIYNHALERFETRKELDPLCLEVLESNPIFEE